MLSVWEEGSNKDHSAKKLMLSSDSITYPNPTMHSELWTDNCFPPICKVLQEFHQILSYHQNAPSASQFLDIKRTHQVNKSDTQIWDWTHRPTSDTFNSRSVVLYSAQEKGEKESSNKDSCKFLMAQTITDIF